MKEYDYFTDYYTEDCLYRVPKGLFHKGWDEHIEIYAEYDTWKEYIPLHVYQYDSENDDNLKPISITTALMIKEKIDNKPYEIKDVRKTKEIITDRNILIDEYPHVALAKGFKDNLNNWFNELRRTNLCFKEYIDNLDKETRHDLYQILGNPNFTNIKEIIPILKRYNSPFLSSKLKIIKHLPHVSLDMPIYDNRYPKFDSRYYTMDSFEFNKYNYKMSDIGVDRLFKFIDGEEIIPKYSRLYCDVEKYLDSKKEIMSRYGMGVIYERLFDNRRVRLLSEKEKEEIINYYKEYHKMFSDKVNQYLNEGYNVLILDLHSFSEEQASLFTTGTYPDICIGINNEYKDDSVTNYIIQNLNKRKLSYKLNFPYSGSFVPDEIDKEKAKGKLVSIMIEVNKKIYL